jgi:hypothetical protein
MTYLKQFKQLYLMSFFFMDVLREEDCRAMIKWASKQGVSGWYFADFIPQKKWYYRSFISLMYLCFALTTRISQRSLLDLKKLYLEEGWEVKGPSTFQANGLVESCYFEQTKI